MNGKKTKKIVKRLLKKSVRPSLSSSEFVNNEERRKKRERDAAFAIAAAKIKIEKLLDPKNETYEPLKQLLENIGEKTATAVLDADDNEFLSADGIEQLWKRAHRVSHSEDDLNNKEYVEQDEVNANGIENETCCTLSNINMDELNTAMQKNCIGDETEEPIPEVMLYEKRLECFENALALISEKKEMYPEGKIKRTMCETEKLLSGVMECFLINEKVVVAKASNRSKKRKSVPPTAKADMICNQRLSISIDKMGTYQHYEFEFAAVDDLLSVYLPQMKELQIDKNCRLFLWATDKQNEKSFQCKFEERENFNKAVKIATEAFHKLESLSYLVAYFDPSHDKKEGPYAEQHIAELILIDQFPKFHHTKAQLDEIEKLKEKEINRRIRMGEDKLEGMLKPFTYIDIRVAKMRSLHNMAKFYFYLVGYINHQVTLLSRLFDSARDIMTRMIEQIHQALTRTGVIPSHCE